MSGNIETHVIERFLARYGEPKHTNPEDFMAEYVRQLFGTPTEVLIQAVQRVIDTHHGPIWPGIRACRQAISDVTAGGRKMPKPSYSEIPKNSSIAKPTPFILDGKSIEELLAEHRTRMGEVDVRRKGTRQNCTLPSVNREAWEARYGKKDRAA